MHAWIARSVSASFLEAYRRCMNGVETPGTNLAMFVPALVCAAFSAEVGLKAILIHAGKSASGHDLLALFNQLPSESRDKVIQLVGMPLDLFNAHLHQAKDAFKDWRYVYEEAGEKTVNLEFVASFASAVSQVVEFTKPAT